MSWKSLEQQSFTHSFLVDHEALHQLDNVNALIDWSKIESLLAGIHSSKRGSQLDLLCYCLKPYCFKVGTSSATLGLEKQLAHDLVKRGVALQ